MRNKTTYASIGVLLCFMLCCLAASAQSPKYSMTYTPHLGGSSGVGIGGGFPAKPLSVHVQSITYPSNFPSAPAGTITAFYLRSRYANPAKDTFINFVLKLGYTTKDSFKRVPTLANPDTFVTGLTTISQLPQLNMSGTDTEGAWIKIPIGAAANGVSFTYMKEQNLVVDLSIGKPLPVGHTFGLAGFDTHDSRRRLLTDTVGVPVSYFTTYIGIILHIGFDLATTGVEAEGGITSFGLFPNPATGGRFNVSFDAKQAIREASVTVTDAAGRQVYSKTYLGVGASFFREVNLSGAAPGVYFVKVAADGAVISRRVVIE